ncbi:MAG: xanthine dehydrogenase family protein molybdopterin-binding subunit [Deltaproteobacteria bacterium]|nr:xanthine dehydrogenase family protein molybdopterin-binding subunit [Deltaproteobacteria bacterium]
MSYRTIGKPVPRIEGQEKVTGGTQFTADVPIAGALWGKVLRSPVSHAKIVKVDTSKAKALPGVHAAIAGADLAPVFVGIRMKDMPVLARDRVRFVGDPVAAVAAESRDIAEEALGLIEIEYEEVPAVFDPTEAMRPGAPLIHENRLHYKNAPSVPEEIPNLQSVSIKKNGNLQDGFKRAARVFEHTFRTQLTHHGYLEPHACVVRIDPDGKVEVWASNKSPYALRDLLADDLGIPKNHIKVHIMSVGGDFGGKASLIDVPICYFLAQRSGRPVKMALDYSEELMAAAHRHPAVITLRTGVEADGTLCAVQATIIFSGGAYAAFKISPEVTVLGGRRLGSYYRIPAVQATTYCVYTNHVPCTQTRTPGSPQVVFAMESQMDIVARELGLDPIEIRTKNLLKEGDASPMGERWQNIAVRETLKKAVQASGWRRVKPGKHRGRGIALYERGTPSGKASAAITIEADGAITLLTGVPDVGPGFYTVVQQIVSETLGVAPENVRVRFEDTDSLPYDPGTGGSRSTNTSGHAAYKAARELRAKLTEVAARRLGCGIQEIRLVNGRWKAPKGKGISFDEIARIAVEENGGPISHLTLYEPTDGPPVTSFAAQVAEVEVDPETGQIAVRKITTAHDAGVVLNTLTFQGQVDGGVINGLGFALMEENPIVEGRITTLNLGDFKIPCIKDIPKLTSVVLQSPTGPAPFQGKSIGEMPNVPTAAAIANAIADAMGVRLFELPLNAEKVYWDLKREKPARSL